VRSTRYVAAKNVAARTTGHYEYGAAHSASPNLAMFSVETGACEARVTSQPKMWPPVPPAIMSMERLITVSPHVILLFWLRPLRWGLTCVRKLVFAESVESPGFLRRSPI